MTGTLIVVGSAPCLYDDLKKALELRPFAAVMLVNGACTSIEQADHMLSGHTVKAEQFVAARKKAFPDASPIRVHANWAKRSSRPEKELPSVTDWHGAEMSTGATSIAKGARIGLRALGFDEIILCGAPMDGSGYAGTEAVVRHDCRRIGDPNHQGHRTIEGYRAKFARLAESEFKGKVFSMSGFTRDCLGEPGRE